MTIFTPILGIKLGLYAFSCVTLLVGAYYGRTGSKIHPFCDIKCQISSLLIQNICGGDKNCLTFRKTSTGCCPKHKEQVSGRTK